MTALSAVAQMVPVMRPVRCERCQRALELACEGLVGTAIYQTFNEYLCPSCGGRNYARTPGNILSVHTPRIGS